MAFKFIVLSAFVVAVANAGILQYQSHPALLLQQEEKLEHYEPEPYDHHPRYNYAYDVHDPHTGDVKSMKESRDGDAVHGSYTLIDSDGHKRIVEYTADHKNGFNAVVRREPTHIVIPMPKPVHKQELIHTPIHEAPKHILISLPLEHAKPALNSLWSHEPLHHW